MVKMDLSARSVTTRSTSSALANPAAVNSTTTITLNMLGDSQKLFHKIKNRIPEGIIQYKFPVTKEKMNCPLFLESAHNFFLR
jgi:hypothetical protein